MIIEPTKITILEHLRDAEDIFERWVGSEQSVESMNARESIIAIAAMIQAEMYKALNIAQGIPPEEAGAPNPAGAPGAANPTAGGGVPAPGGPGFSGGGGGQNSAPPPAQPKAPQ